MRRPVSRAAEEQSRAEAAEARLVELLEGRDYETWARRVEAAEAEVRRLKQENDELAEQAYQDRSKAQRLTEGLREISGEASKGIRAENRLPFLTHIGVIAETVLAGDPERHVRALLAGSEADPVRREMKVDPAMFGESNRLLGEPDEGGEA